MEKLGLGGALRFVVHIGNYVALFYLLYYLRDHIGMADPDTGVLLLTVIYAGCTVLILSLTDQLWVVILGALLVLPARGSK